MNATNRERRERVSLDQLLALNDEIAALVRAGIPLEKGLTELGREAPGKLGVLASRLADRMNAGESLREILEKDESTFPPAWRAVMLAGIRSDHLAAALESLSLTGRRAMELRRSMALALIYPGIVVALAYLLFLFTMAYIVPVIARAHEDLTGELDPVLSTVVELGRSVHIWGVAIPLVCVIGSVWWWYRAGLTMRSFHGSRGGGRRRFLFRRHRARRFPSIRQSIIDGRMATFAEVLRLLDQHDVPLPEAIVLAANASGDRVLIGAARSIAQRLEKGETISRREELPHAFPPLLGWSILSGIGRTGLQRTLASSAEMYRQRALRAERWAAVYLPILLTVVVGGSAVLAQVLVVFVPFVSLLYRLGAPL